MQPSPPANFSTFPSPPKATLCAFSLKFRPGNHWSPCCVWICLLWMLSYKCNHAICALWRLASLTFPRFTILLFLSLLGCERELKVFIQVLTPIPVTCFISVLSLGLNVAGWSGEGQKGAMCFYWSGTWIQDAPRILGHSLVSSSMIALLQRWLWGRAEVALALPWTPYLSLASSSAQSGLPLSLSCLFRNHLFFKKLRLQFKFTLWSLKKTVIFVWSRAIG